MAKKVRVRVDHNLCVGNAMCETFAPHVFRLNDDRQSEAVDPDGDPVEQILEEIAQHAEAHPEWLEVSGCV